MFGEEAYKMSFAHAAAGAMVRSIYHADQRAHGVVRRQALPSRNAKALVTRLVSGAGRRTGLLQRGAMGT